MSDHQGDHQLSCSTLKRLNRARVLGQDVYERTVRRKVDWPKPKLQKHCPRKDQLVDTTLEEAFSSVLEFMAKTTANCRSYYNTPEGEDRKSEHCEKHCRRFHTQYYTNFRQRNLIQTDSTINRGMHSVSTGAWLLDNC